MESAVLDARAAAAYVSGTARPVSPRTMANWRWSGVGPKFVRVGGQIRYRKADLDAWLESRIEAPGARS